VVKSVLRRTEVNLFHKDVLTLRNEVHEILLNSMPELVHFFECIGDITLYHWC